jgi:hypothetical protein
MTANDDLTGEEALGIVMGLASRLKGETETMEGKNVKANIDVSDRKEAEYIRAGLDDPIMRAQVVVLGALKSLSSDRARKRVLNFVMDYFDEHPGQVTE